MAILLIANSNKYLVPKTAKIAILIHIFFGGAAVGAGAGLIGIVAVGVAAGAISGALIGGALGTIGGFLIGLHVVGVHVSCGVKV